MWQSRPIFISSTFADMQEERDYLRTRVFPELEERLRARRHHLEWVDLRVGVATASHRDEQVRELHVLKVCLDEVRRCRPFLIVLMGDRYGWVPPEERIKAAAEEAREGFAADVAGRSVTDLEIEFGVLSDMAQQTRSFFYLRDPLPYAQMPAGIAGLYSEDYATDDQKSDRNRRLAALKQRIERQLPERVRHYAAQWDAAQLRPTGLEAWGRIVLEDIWSEFDAETAASAAEVDLPWDQIERDALEDFVDDRARDFVGRDGFLHRLTGLAVGSDVEARPKGVCVTGGPGSGKSALFGELYRRLQGGEALLLAHAAGASPQAASVDTMLRRWIGELSQALAADPGLAENASADEVDRAFARLLDLAARRGPVVMLVDALDQFEATARGRYATWVPRLWPDNVHFIMTAIPGDASRALAERFGVETLSLPPLDVDEAHDIVVGICRRYHRTFESEVIDALLAKSGADGPAWQSPLWLALAVEDLNLLDADDFARAHRQYAGAPAERLRALMLDAVAGYPSDISGLYAHTFERAEASFGAGIARGFLGLIAISRFGWRESDLRVLLPRVSGETWDELEFAQLRRLFRGQLRQRSALGQWDFNHPQMRGAACLKLADWGLAEKNLHAMAADRLLSCAPDDPLHISETMVHLLAAQDYGRAARYYGDDSLSVREAQGATRILAESIIAPTIGTPAAAAETVCRLLHAAEDDEGVRVGVAHRFIFTLCPTLEDSAAVDARLIVADQTKRVFKALHEQHPGDQRWPRYLSAALVWIGDAHVLQGDHLAALEAYREGVAIAEPLEPANPDDVALHLVLSNAYQKIGQQQTATRDFSDALASFNRSLAVRIRLAQAVPQDSSLQRNVLIVLAEMAEVQGLQGDLDDALKSYRKVIAALESLARSDPGNVGLQDDLQKTHGKAGDILRTRRDFSGAMTAYRAGLAIAQQLAQSNPANAAFQREVSILLSLIGDMWIALDDLVGALTAYHESYKSLSRLTKLDPGNAVWQSNLESTAQRIAHVQMVRGTRKAAAGDLADALEFCRGSLEIFNTLYRSSPDNPVRQRDLAEALHNFGCVQMDGGDLAGAQKNLSASLGMRERLASSGAVDVGLERELLASYDRLGDFAVANSDPAGGIALYRKGVAIRERFASAAPDDAGLQRELSIALNRLGNVQFEQSDLRGALKCYCESGAIRERLVRSDPANALWQRDLSVSFNGIGDVQAAFGDDQGALNSYREALMIAERLAQSDPTDAGLLRDLIISYVKIANVDKPQARHLLMKAADIARHMQETGLLRPRDAWIPGDLARRLAELPS